MFIGKYYHTLESQGRVSLPKKIREQADTWVITRGLDGGLFLYPQSSYESEISKLEFASVTKKTNRDLVRLFSNEAVEVSPDKQGRIALPEYLIAFASLTKDVVVVGSISKVEIWDMKRYHTYAGGLETQAEEIAEKYDTQQN
ncbi:MAG: division/cell wall cluster transcriptional repressor MraZ [Candidatus Pacebacteria bacterium CG_4_10_14_0_8_um_filter_42_14]|nr:MAG: division/cell wall cluster transcriptional repressor MraZ [Candidatus Pacebacteria bacterium CG_4_10_14_0_8_um_filter_42_14]